MLIIRALALQVFSEALGGVQRKGEKSSTLEDVSVGKPDSHQGVVVLPHFPLFFFLSHGSRPQH